MSQIHPSVSKFQVGDKNAGLIWGGKSSLTDAFCILVDFNDDRRSERTWSVLVSFLDIVDVTVDVVLALT